MRAFVGFVAAGGWSGGQTDRHRHAAHLYARSRLTKDQCATLHSPTHYTKLQRVSTYKHTHTHAHTHTSVCVCENTHYDEIS